MSTSLPIVLWMAQESLRVKASVATVPRSAVKDVRVGNIEVPKGTTVLCAKYTRRRVWGTFQLTVERNTARHPLPCAHTATVGYTGPRTRAFANKHACSRPKRTGGVKRHAV